MINISEGTPKHFSGFSRQTHPVASQPATSACVISFLQQGPHRKQAGVLLFDRHDRVSGEMFALSMGEPS